MGQPVDRSVHTRIADREQAVRDCKIGVEFDCSFEQAHARPVPGHEVRRAADEEKRSRIVALKAERSTDVGRRLLCVLVPVMAPLRVGPVTQSECPEPVRQSELGSNYDGSAREIGSGIQIFPCQRSESHHAAYGKTPGVQTVWWLTPVRLRFGR